jgi:HAE1 family hydrophobic/amphiphilic exporter-1
MKPSGWPYRIDYTGESEDMMESFGYALQSLLLAVILIYAVLASQFRSFLQPFAIMLSLPLSLVGVAGMLYLVNDTLNIMSMIGVILLMGLVTKNAILLVDFANVQRREGRARRDALIIAARVRLRPILMTTLAMIFGMLPLAFEIGSGAEFRAPMARAVIGGLITSTLLTLIVVPVVYTYLEDLGDRFVRWWSHKTTGDARAEATLRETAAK